MPSLAFLGCSALSAAACSLLAAQTRWVPLAAAGPGVRSDVALAYDVGRGCMVLTGGWDGSNNLADVWEFDGTAWHARVAAGGPGPHSSHALVYDAARQRVVMFGGWTGTRILDETWEWDGAAGTWTRRQPTNVPPPRYSHQLAYDSMRQRVVMFGGYCGTGCALADTWEWDGAAGTWTQRTPATAPAGRYSFGMCFDDRSQRVLLFGGRLLSARAADLWAWDGGAGTWTPLMPAGVLPAPRSTHRVAFDGARARMVLFGGFTGVWSNDTWEWDGIAWQQRSPAGAPSGRGYYGFEYDRARGRCVLFGGDVGTGPVASAFVYEPMTAARALEFGLGCPSRPTPPALRTQAGTRPWLGTTITLVASQLASASPAAALAFGASDGTWLGTALPLDLTPVGMPGCALLVAPDLLMPAPVQSGLAAWTLALPGVPSLLGASAFAQGFAVESGANPLGVVATNGLRLTLGGL